MKELLIKLALTFIAITLPIHNILIAVICLIFVDLVTGIWKAVKLKEKISSAAMRRTVTKILVYNLAILSGFTVEAFLIPDLPLIKLVSAVIGLVEIKSILENLNTISGQDIFKALIKKLGSDNDK